MPTFPLFDGDVIWILAGLSIVLTSLIAGGRAFQRVLRRMRILRARVAGVADAREGELVILHGRARGGEAVRTPITAKNALWFRLIVRGEVARPGMLSFSTLLREVQSRKFVVEDPNGTKFEISAEKAHVVVAKERIDRSYTPQDGTFEPRLIPLFRQHIEFGVLSDDKALVAIRTFEEILLDGDEVSVIGVARRNGPLGFRLEPGRDGLFVVQGDVKALAASGALWKEAPDVE